MGFFSNLMASVGGGNQGELPSSAMLIDVRSQAEFASGHIDGAFNLPLDRFNHDIHKVVTDKDTPVILYCRSGARSGHALSVMRQQGYRNVFNGGGVGALAMRLQKDIRRG